MKKLIVITALLGIIATTNAQDRIAIGLKAGFNSTKLNLSDVPSEVEVKNEAKSGFLIGAYGKLRLTESFSIQPELYYAKKTSELSVIDGADSESIDGTFHTWDVPILANLQILDLSVVKVYGIAGPVASFIAKTKTDIPEWDDFKSTNWTFQAGAGVEVWRLTADVRYEWGMSDISKLDIGQKTDVLTFSVGFKLLGL
ncbi:porin family protein [Carboxylicivirga linearis]|uniref:PorT family protein n=1 Tax=Carboxylicivirga linearis TaxID=1628157 RepID=A0ABS5JSS8_9BACT|nr:porin family protein [Carboxylicivirga linearis]MBS2097868.1 PorT family protein [Carboxylicivirga linearis]